MDTTIMVGIASALAAGSLPLLLTHLLARGDRKATAEQRFQATITAAHTHCQEELGAAEKRALEAQGREDDWREKYYAELAQRLTAGSEDAEVRPAKPPLAGG